MRRQVVTTAGQNGSESHKLVCGCCKAHTWIKVVIWLALVYMASKIGVCVPLLLIKRRNGFSGEETIAEYNLTIFAVLLDIITHFCTNILLILGSITENLCLLWTAWAIIAVALAPQIAYVAMEFSIIGLAFLLVNAVISTIALYIIACRLREIMASREYEPLLEDPVFLP